MFRPPIDRCLNDDSATAGIRTINCVRFDESPLARWAPVLIKLTITVFRILVRVLLPGQVLVPYPKRRFKVLPLERSAEGLRLIENREVFGKVVITP